LTLILTLTLGGFVPSLFLTSSSGLPLGWEMRSGTFETERTHPRRRRDGVTEPQDARNSRRARCRLVPYLNVRCIGDVSYLKVYLGTIALA
jgi:hypothetical protein